MRSTNRFLALVRRQRFWAGILVGVLLTLGVYVAASGGGDLESGPLVVLSGRDDGAGGQRQALIDQWNALHPRQPAVIREVSGIADAQHIEMVAQAQWENAGVDIFNLDVTWTAEFAHAGYLRAVDTGGLDTTGFLDKPLETCRYDGRLWALPFNTDAGLLYYRSDLVARAPDDWEQARAQIAQVFARPQGAPPALVAGYTGQYADYEGLTVNAMEAIWAAGGDVVRDDKVVFDARAAEGLQRLARELHSANPAYLLGASRQYYEAESTQAFLDGKVVFLRNWPVAYQQLAPQAPSESSRLPPVAVAHLPGPSVLGGQNLAVSAHSAHPRAAQALIEFLTSPRSQQILFERGGFAATQSVVYHDRKILEGYPYAQALYEAVQNARLRPVTPHYTTFSRVFREGVRYALDHGGTVPEDFVAQLEAALRGQ